MGQHVYSVCTRQPLLVANDVAHLRNIMIWHLHLEPSISSSCNWTWTAGGRNLAAQSMKSAASQVPRIASHTSPAAA
jgi:hypothetical protein